MADEVKTEEKVATPPAPPKPVVTVKSYMKSSNKATRGTLDKV